MGKISYLVILSLLIIYGGAKSVKLSEECSSAQESFYASANQLRNDLIARASTQVLQADVQNLSNAGHTFVQACQSELPADCLSAVNSLQATAEQISQTISSGNRDPNTIKFLLSQFYSQSQAVRASCTPSNNKPLSDPKRESVKISPQINFKLSQECSAAQQNFQNSVNQLKTDFVSGASREVLQQDVQNISNAGKTFVSACQGEVPAACTDALNAVQNTANQLYDVIQSGNRDPVLFRSLLTQLLSQVQTAQTACSPASQGFFKPLSSQKLGGFMISAECQEAQNNVDNAVGQLLSDFASDASPQVLENDVFNIESAGNQLVQVCSADLSTDCIDQIQKAELQAEQIRQAIESGDANIVQIRTLVSGFLSQIHYVRTVCAAQ